MLEVDSIEQKQSRSVFHTAGAVKVKARVSGFDFTSGNDRKCLIILVIK